MTEAEREREAVVAWLRRRADFDARKAKLQQKDYFEQAYDMLRGTTKGAADAIERGDHIKDSAP